MFSKRYCSTRVTGPRFSLDLYKPRRYSCLFYAFPLLVLGGDITLGPMEIEKLFVFGIVVIELEKSLGNFVDDGFVQPAADCPHVIHERRRRPEYNHLIDIDFLRTDQLVPYQIVQGSGTDSPGLYPSCGGIVRSAEAELREVLLRVDSRFKQIIARHQVARSRADTSERKGLPL